MVFATFLKASGVGDWMTGLATATCGGSIGGPAKAAVVASALQGTVSGSSVANVVSTGSITIPLMKKDWLSAALCRRGGSDGFNRRTDHAAGRAPRRLS